MHIPQDSSRTRRSKENAQGGTDRSHQADEPERIDKYDSSGYYRWKALHGKEPACWPADQSEKELKLINAVLDAYTEHPAFGYRKMGHFLSSQGIENATEKWIRLLCKRLGLRGASQTFKTTRPPKEKFQKYPYLLKNKPVLFVNQVWATDITYIRLPHRMVYLVAIIDLYGRKILSWRLSDNIRVERAWKTVKYEFVFLYEWSSKGQLGKGLEGFIKAFNKERPHEALRYQTPDEIYERGCFPVEETDTVEVA